MPILAVEPLESATAGETCRFTISPTDVFSSVELSALRVDVVSCSTSHSLSVPCKLLHQTTGIYAASFEPTRSGQL